MVQNSYFVTNSLYNLLGVNGKWLNHHIELGCYTGGRLPPETENPLSPALVYLNRVTVFIWVALQVQACVCY